ncbi:MAG: hypothetical protein ABIL39_11220, partial [candidate division WOR-3 bacterium]
FVSKSYAQPKIKSEEYSVQFESKMILPKWGYLIKINYLTQVLENIGTPKYIFPERSPYDRNRHSGGSIYHESQKVNN